MHGKSGGIGRNVGLGLVVLKVWDGLVREVGLVRAIGLGLVGKED